jgi:hypothetical protein
VSDLDYETPETGTAETDTSREPGRDADSRQQHETPGPADQGYCEYTETDAEIEARIAGQDEGPSPQESRQATWGDNPDYFDETAASLYDDYFDPVTTHEDSEAAQHAAASPDAENTHTESAIPPEDAVGRYAKDADAATRDQDAASTAEQARRATEAGPDDIQPHPARRGGEPSSAVECADHQSDLSGERADHPGSGQPEQPDRPAPVPDAGPLDSSGESDGLKLSVRPPAEPGPEPLERAEATTIPGQDTRSGGLIEPDQQQQSQGEQSDQPGDREPGDTSAVDAQPTTAEPPDTARGESANSVDFGRGDRVASGDDSDGPEEGSSPGKIIISLNLGGGPKEYYADGIAHEIDGGAGGPQQIIGTSGSKADHVIDVPTGEHAQENDPAHLFTVPDPALLATLVTVFGKAAYRKVERHVHMKKARNRDIDNQ